jgi:hypothetical protein
MDQVLVKVHLPTTVLLSKWYETPLWSSWASRLDNSRTFYVLPDEYSLLVKATGYRPPHFRWSCGDANLIILGNSDPNSIRHDGQWISSLPQEFLLVKWAKTVHNERLDTSMKLRWDEAFSDAWNYYVRHRDLVRKIGKVIETDADGHNLTKTTMVLYAIGYVWFWPHIQDHTTKELAVKVIRERHLKREDHYVEYPGMVDPKRVVADKLATHILYDKECDGQKGWDLSSWIYPEVNTDYQYLKKEFGHTDLYHLPQLPESPLPQLWYMEKK